MVFRLCELFILVPLYVDTHSHSHSPSRKQKHILPYPSHSLSMCIKLILIYARTLRTFKCPLPCPICEQTARPVGSITLLLHHSQASCPPFPHFSQRVNVVITSHLLMYTYANTTIVIVWSLRALPPYFYRNAKRDWRPLFYFLLCNLRFPNHFLSSRPLPQCPRYNCSF